MKLKPGNKAPFSGQYAVIGPRGGSSGKEITISKGETLPPSPTPGVSYRISDRTNNKSGKK